MSKSELFVLWVEVPNGSETAVAGFDEVDDLKVVKQYLEQMNPTYKYWKMPMVYVESLDGEIGEP